MCTTKEFRRKREKGERRYLRSFVDISILKGESVRAFFPSSWPVRQAHPCPFLSPSSPPLRSFRPILSFGSLAASFQEPLSATRFRMPTPALMRILIIQSSCARGPPIKHTQTRSKSGYSYARQGIEVFSIVTMHPFLIISSHSRI